MVKLVVDVIVRGIEVIACAFAICAGVAAVVIAGACMAIAKLTDWLDSWE